MVHRALTASASVAPLRRTQADRRAATRTRLLDAAVACLAELGYPGTTFPEVVRRAGMSNGALWRHFQSKNELLAAAALHCEEQLRAVAASVGSSESARIEACVDVLLDWIATPSGQALLELLSACRSDGELRAALLADDDRAASLFFDVVRDLLGPELSAHPDFLSAARLLGLSLYGIGLTARMRSESGDRQLRAELSSFLRLRLGDAS